MKADTWAWRCVSISKTTAFPMDPHLAVWPAEFSLEPLKSAILTQKAGTPVADDVRQTALDIRGEPDIFAGLSTLANRVPTDSVLST